MNSHTSLVCLGAQIIDLMLLVVDIVKGMQTQTAECLVIGEITCEKMIIVLNKLDLIPPDKQPSTLDKVRLKQPATLDKVRLKQPTTLDKVKLNSPQHWTR